MGFIVFDLFIACVDVCVCAGQKSMSGVFFCNALPYFLDQGFLLKWELIKLVRLAG